MEDAARGHLNGPDRPKRRRVLLIVGVTAVAALLLAFVPRISQPQDYHHFADQRAILGIPRFFDVLSNLPFLFVGLLGLLAVRSSSGRVLFLDSRERWAYVVFFGGVLATAFGSAWYHLDPGDARLIWDRLAIAIAFMGFLAAMIGERISPQTGLRFLAPLAFIGAGSVFYLQWTESLGRGDLRAYLFVQFFPIVLVPLLVLLFPARYTRSADLLGAVGLYAAAKICEALDAQIFSLGHLVSGHTLKHLFAAAAPLCILSMLRRRNRLQLTAPRP